jgi:hypothetical protein
MADTLTDLLDTHTNRNKDKERIAKSKHKLAKRKLELQGLKLKEKTRNTERKIRKTRRKLSGYKPIDVKENRKAQNRTGKGLSKIVKGLFKKRR